MHKSYTAVDLFCGCGGLTLGLKQGGYDVILAIDNDPLSVATYRKNHRNTRVIEEDIAKVSPLRLMRELGLKRGDLDLLAGCPPCQGFSVLRSLNGGKRQKDPRNKLVLQFLRFARVFRPKAIMLENVPGLIGNWRFRLLCRGLRKLRYSVKYDVFDAANYGVPQRRKRMILIGSRLGAVEFADQSKKRKTVRDAIAHLPKPGASGDALHDYPVNRSAEVVKLIRKIPANGGGRSSLPSTSQLECHKQCDGFYDIYGRMAWDEPAPTITSGCINPSKGRFVHPRQHRAITLREAALLQGFPKYYHFEMVRGRYPAAEMIGNAFPPPFSRRHAAAIRTQLEKVTE